MLIPITTAEARPGLTVYGIQGDYRYKGLIRSIIQGVIYIDRTDDSRQNNFPPIDVDEYDEHDGEDETDGRWLCYPNNFKRNETDLSLYGGDCAAGILLFEPTPEQAAKELANIKSLENHTKKKINKSDFALCTMRNIKVSMEVYMNTKSKAYGALTAGTVETAVYGRPSVRIILHEPDNTAEKALLIDDETQDAWTSLDSHKSRVLDEIIRKKFPHRYAVTASYNPKLECFTLENNIRLYVKKSDLPKPGKCICTACGKRGAKFTGGYCETCSYKPF